MKKISVKDAIDRDEKLGIPSFYDVVSLKLINKVAKLYDCRRISVANNLFDIIRSYYVSKGADSVSFAMAWLGYGPKVDESLNAYEVIVEEGFIVEA